MEMLSPEKLAQIKAVLTEIDANTANQSLIQDNKILFSFKGKGYRCRMPNQKEQSLAEQAQHKLKIKLANEPGNVTKDQLIKNLKKNVGFDVEEKENQKAKLRQKLQDAYLELALIPSDNKSEIENKRKQKQEIESKFMDVCIELADMLAPCIQEQAKVEYYRTLAYLCTDSDDESRVWKTYEDFCNDDSGLTYKALEYLQSLLLNVRD